MNYDSLTLDQALAEAERRGLVPIRGSYILAIGAAIAALASSYAAYSASQAQAAQAEYGAKAAGEQARVASEAGKVAEANQREEDTKTRAALRARIGASGAQETGAPLLAELESAGNAEVNARRIRWSAETRTAGFQSEQKAQRYYATQARRQGYVQAGTALLTGAAKTYAYGRGAGGDSPGLGTYSYMPGSDYYSTDR